MLKDLNSILIENENLIRGICRTFYPLKADQDDLFQEIVIRVIKSYDSFRGQSKFSTWLYRVAINTAVTHSNKKKKFFNIPLIESQTIASTEGEIKGERDIDFLYKAIDRLNKVEKAIIHLYLEENTYVEIAEIIGISEKNVSVKIVRIKRKLKDIILGLQN